ncbi:MAG TPA: type II toxin-antitoxin system PemK/MazF family toxin [Stellaceae bacterium]|nr:type II toxin-antitoxin system PemK/MazF family toxin [Stellaceae bacterium]
MPMGRGDVVIVAAPGDYGKPRPAVIVQSDAIPEAHRSVIICQMTSEIVEADFRITVEPGSETGLQVRSQVMADKPVTVRRERVSRQIGRLRIDEMARLNAALAFVLGLAD